MGIESATCNVLLPPCVLDIAKRGDHKVIAVAAGHIGLNDLHLLSLFHSLLTDIDVEGTHN